MKNLLPIFIFAIAVALCKSPEEQAWDQRTIYDANKMTKVLDAGVSPNLEAASAPKRFLLQNATEMHRLDTVKVLLDRGADPTKKHGDSGRPASFWLRMART